MTQPTLNEMLDQKRQRCVTCDGFLWNWELNDDGECPNCELERQRMAEFDALIESDADVKRVWQAFEARCDRLTNGAPKKRLSWMSVFCFIRENAYLHCSNTLGPMMARKYDSEPGRSHFTHNRLKP